MSDLSLGIVRIIIRNSLNSHNSFSELNDSFEQKERLLKQQKLLDKGDSEAQVLDDDFIKVGDK